MGIPKLYRFVAAVYYSLICLAIFGGCSGTPRNIVTGNWSGEMIRITQGKETVSIPCAKYGYLNVSIHSDSSFVFDLGVLRDVTVERQAFGVAANTVLIPAVYKSTRYGKWSRSDSSVVLRASDMVIVAALRENGHTLQLDFTDPSGRTWLCSLTPKE